jgi:hypothetical protein
MSAREATIEERVSYQLKTPRYAIMEMYGAHKRPRKSDY